MLNKSKIIKGGFYLTVVNILAQVLAVVVNIVLARLLLPSDFGLVALTTTFIGFITLFTNIGFGSAIIHEQKATHKQLSSIYWFNFGLSLLSFLAVISTSQLAADFYDKPQLTSIVFVAALNILITPFFITHYKLLERDLEFKLISKMNLIGIVFGSVAAVIGAYYGLGVYALLLQTLISSMTRLVLVLKTSKWSPLRQLNYGEVKGMIWYSIKYKASSVALYFERNVDYLILGKFFTSAILGYYAFAYNIMYTPVKRISYIFSNVLFPTFSAIKDNKEKIIEGYFKSIQLIAMVSFPAMALISFNAELIIQIVFGHKWDAAIPIVKILCFAGAIQSISQLGGVIFSSIGKPEISLYISIGRTILTVLAILIGVQYGGVLLVAYFLVIAKALSFLLFLIVLKFQISFSVIRLMDYLKGPIISILVLGGLYILFNLSQYQDYRWLKLGIMLIVSLVTLLLFHYKTLSDVIKILKAKTVE